MMLVVEDAESTHLPQTVDVYANEFDFDFRVNLTIQLFEPFLLLIHFLLLLLDHWFLVFWNFVWFRWYLLIGLRGISRSCWYGIEKVAPAILHQNFFPRFLFIFWWWTGFLDHRKGEFTRIRRYKLYLKLLLIIIFLLLGIF